MNELYCFGKQKNKFLQEKINKAYFNEIIEFNKQKNFLSYANASHNLYIHCAERSERILFYAKHSSIANFDDISKFACGMTLNQRKNL